MALRPCFTTGLPLSYAIVFKKELANEGSGIKLV